MAKKRTPSAPTRRTIPPLGLAVLSGVLLACAFPPIDWPWLIWVGLIPLLEVVRRAAHPRRAFLYGYTAGAAFFLINLHPLVSAHSWTGWAEESAEAFALRMNQQWWFMQGIWVAFAVWCAVWWGGWAALVRRTASSPWRLLLIAPAAWIIGPEWLRAHGTFGFAWGFLGNATADLAAIRQTAALGGVWLLSALVVAVNVGLAVLWPSPRRRDQVAVSTACAGLWLAASLGGVMAMRMAAASGSPPVLAAALQRAKPAYNLADFTATGFDRGYFPMIQQALQQRAQLVILPESIALGDVTLDGSRSGTKPPEWQHPRAGWDAQMTSALRGTASVLMMGTDTVERGEDHNTLIAWDARHVLGWYHKRGLVPFSEYEPWPWAPWAIRGKSQYSPGRGSQLIRVSDDLVIGGFICQEVLFPGLIRQSVRDGATLLVSGGNDGVFGDPAVARVHADAAQIRAAEAGRYMIRAMKTGISGILDPGGRELARSVSSEPAVLVQPVAPRRTFTPYARFGDWVVGLALAVMCWGMLTAAWAGRPS